MYPVYSIDTLKSKSLAELKAIASERGITPEGNKVYKQTWIDAIDKLQDNPIWRNAYVKTEQPAIETTESIVESPESTVEEVAPVAIQELKTCGNCPHFKPHDDTTNKGWCCLFDVFARESHAMTQDCISTMEDAARVDDYLFHNDPTPMEQPTKLPKVGDRHHIGDFALRCSQVGGKYATVWEVYQDKLPLGEIRMLWNTFWEHTYSGENLFATPQLAVVDLVESIQKQKEQAMTNHIVRRFTKNWLQTQECTIVGYWGDSKVDLWDVIDIYAQSVSEGDSIEDALYTNFPNIADDLQIETTTNNEFGYAQMMRNFEGCPQVMAFFKGDAVAHETSPTPADLAY